MKYVTPSGWLVGITGRYGRLPTTMRAVCPGVRTNITVYDEVMPISHTSRYKR
jgi:hypothetical protein